MKRLGIFGGTFDPVHHGHLIVATEMLGALALDEVIFIPAGDPPHKPEQLLSSDNDRVEMLHLALADRPPFIVDMTDLERTGPSYTADSLEILSDARPDSELFFIMGTDSLMDLPTWHDPSRILSKAHIAVAHRPNVNVDLPALESLLPGVSKRTTVVDVPEIEISSSDIRTRVARGVSIWYQVPRSVEEYIHAHALYQIRSRRISSN